MWAWLGCGLGVGVASISCTSVFSVLAMAEPVFSRSMSNKELCNYLEELGLEGDDLKKIEAGRYNGKTVLLLNRNNQAGLRKLGLSDAGTLVLEMILEDECSVPSGASMDQPIPSGASVDQLILSGGSVDQPIPSGGSVDLPSGNSIDEPDAAPKMPEEQHQAPVQLKRSLTLEAETECQEYTSFGLGYGVDATDPAPLRSKHGKVRIVLPNLKNVEEAMKKERKKYEEIISSIITYSSSVHLSVSDIVAKSLTLSAEGEFSRERSKEMMARGERMTIRSVTFKPFGSKEYHDADSLDIEDTNFEKDLCEWLISQMPDIKLFPGKSDAEKVQMYLLETPDKFDDVVHNAYLFVKTEKITHYVSALSLGASIYSVTTTTKTALSVGVRGEVGTDLVASGGAGVKRSKEKTNVTSKDQRIGEIEIVERGKGEAVVGYELLPAYTLLRQEKLKQALQKAIQLYLKRESGPFYIVCGHDDKYLKVEPFGGRNVLLATKDKDEAGIFYIEKSVCPGEFCIAYYGGEVGSETTSSMYVVTKSKLTGKENGPLQVGGGRAANFTLRHVSKENTELSVSKWEKDTCYVKLAPRATQHKSYLALNEKSNATMCVAKREAEKVNSVWLRFKLERIRSEDSNRMTVYRAPTARKLTRRKLVVYPEVEEEIDFEHEFGRSSDLDSD